MTEEREAPPPDVNREMSLKRRHPAGSSSSFAPAPNNSLTALAQRCGTSGIRAARTPSPDLREEPGCNTHKVGICGRLSHCLAEYVNHSTSHTKFTNLADKFGSPSHSLLGQLAGAIHLLRPDISTPDARRNITVYGLTSFAAEGSLLPAASRMA